ncbi:MAG: orotate phosphoribosyltransferase [Deltaproteobacteria bacterium]|nr:orotate phosphoribosyltransferase [Deltaproteobacteria bacterium]
MRDVDFGLSQELITLLLEANALRFGEFTLKSGETSPFFVNLGEVARGRHLLRLSELIATVVSREFPNATVLFGPAYKGIGLVALAAAELARAHATDIGTCYNRKETKAHGEGGVLVGVQPTSDDRVVVIDDVISSGLTKLEAVELLTQSGVKPVGIIVFVDRRRRSARTTSELAGVPLVAISSLEDLAKTLEARGDPRAKAIRDFYEGQT